jgi:hypothetical protein
LALEHRLELVLLVLELHRLELELLELGLHILELLEQEHKLVWLSVLWVLGLCRRELEHKLVLVPLELEQRTPVLMGQGLRKLELELSELGLSIQGPWELGQNKLVPVEAVAVVPWEQSTHSSVHLRSHTGLTQVLR